MCHLPELLRIFILTFLSAVFHGFCVRTDLVWASVGGTCSVSRRDRSAVSLLTLIDVHGFIVFAFASLNGPIHCRRKRLLALLCLFYCNLILLVPAIAENPRSIMPPEKRTADSMSGNTSAKTSLHVTKDSSPQTDFGSSSVSRNTTNMKPGLYMPYAILQSRRFQSFGGLQSIEIGDGPKRSHSEVFQQSPPKRRRFHRRNSATSAMLTKSLSSIMDVTETPKTQKLKMSDCSKLTQNTDFSLEDGIKIAQGLVQDLRHRRQIALEPTESEEDKRP